MSYKPHRKNPLHQLFPFSWHDFFVTAVILSCAAVLCILLQPANSRAGFAAPVFILAVLLISRLTTGYLFGFIASVLGVVCVNFIFTYPYWAVNFTLSGYPLTFIVFLAASIMTCALTTQARQSERLRAENEKEKMRSNLLRSVSHDIRTPLTSIVGASSALLENPELPLAERQELLEDVREEAQWLIRVVENLLSVTRIGGSSASITKELEAAEEVLGESVRKFRRRFPHIAVSVEAPDELLLVPMESILIEQVLSNLLENAVIHGETTTQVYLSVRKEEEYACFIVGNDGQAISEKAFSTLFEPSSAPGGPSAGDGKRNMGLGLSVCMAIVRAHGGTMSAHNLPNGAEFIFRLPLASQGGTS